MRKGAFYEPLIGLFRNNSFILSFGFIIIIKIYIGVSNTLSKEFGISQHFLLSNRSGVNF